MQFRTDSHPEMWALPAPQLLPIHSVVCGCGLHLGKGQGARVSSKGVLKASCRRLPGISVILPPALSPEEKKVNVITKSYTAVPWVALGGNVACLCPWVHQLERKATVSRAIDLFWWASEGHMLHASLVSVCFRSSISEVIVLMSPR